MPVPHCSGKELAELQESLKEDEKSLSRSSSNASTLSEKEVNSKTALMAYRSISTQTLDSDMNTSTDEKEENNNKDDNNGQYSDAANHSSSL